MKYAAVVLGFALLLGGCAADGDAGADKLVHKTDPDAVREVAAGKRSIASAAWWGFDEQDSTRFLQAAIRSGARKLVIPNLGKPWVVTPLFLESNREIVFEPGVVLAAREGAFLDPEDAMLTAKEKENITLRGAGASIVMRRQDYLKPPYKKAEWRHCLQMLGCRNVTVRGLRLASSGGDGIYLGRGKLHRIHNQDITLEDVTCEDHHRQGISVITAENLLVDRCTLRGTQGTDPEAGIDFEPNKPDERLVNCVVRDCIIDHNAGFGILMYLKHLGAESEPISINVTGCQVQGNRAGALAIHKASTVRGEVRLKPNKLEGKQDLDRGPQLKVRADP
jgi:hypothetical protein